MVVITLKILSSVVSVIWLDVTVMIENIKENKMIKKIKNVLTFSNVAIVFLFVMYTVVYITIMSSPVESRNTQNVTVLEQGIIQQDEHRQVHYSLSKVTGEYASHQVIVFTYNGNISAIKIN